MTRSHRRAWVFGAFVAGAALSLAACSGGATSQQDPSVRVAMPNTSTSTTPTSAAAPSTMPEALAFQATTVDGAAFDGASLAGKPVVFWFWAPWCTVCRSESPDLAKVAQEFSGKVTFVGIAGLGPVQDMQKFVTETGTGNFMHLADVDGSLWSRFGVVAQPSFVFVTPSGTAKEVNGGLSADDLRAAAAGLLSS